MTQNINNITLTEYLAGFAPEGKELPYPQAANWTLFLDIDGTISDLAEKPEDAFIPLPLLAMLDKHKTIPVALVTGRSMESADRMTHPFHFALAAEHGLSLRDPQGNVTNNWERNNEQLYEALRIMEQAAKFDPAINLERKELSVTLHYREVPETDADALKMKLLDYLSEQVTRLKGFKLQQGKKVMELRPACVSKGSAIAAMMQWEGFKGKLPVFAGDDVTDEDGFAEVNARSGISIKVGKGETLAQYRIAGPFAMRDWLNDIIPLLTNATQERNLV